MLESVTLSGVGGHYEFELNKEAANTPLALTSISGLSSASVRLQIGEFAEGSSYYQGFRNEARNLVLTFRLANVRGDNVSNIRQQLHELMFQGRSSGAAGVDLTITDSDLGTLTTTMYTEKFEHELFSSSGNITVIANTVDPYLYSTEATTTPDGTSYVSVPISYSGTAQTGFLAAITVNGMNDTVTLEKESSDGSIRRLVLQWPFSTDDMLVVSTRDRQRFVYLNPLLSGPSYEDPEGQDIAAALTQASEFFKVDGATSHIRAYGGWPEDGGATINMLTYNDAYWGI